MEQSQNLKFKHKNAVIKFFVLKFLFIYVSIYFYTLFLAPFLFFFFCLNIIVYKLGV